MRIFLAGASGAIGRRLTPLLRAAGHDVSGMTRTPATARELEAAGVSAAVRPDANADENTAQPTADADLTLDDFRIEATLQPDLSLKVVTRVKAKPGRAALPPDHREAPRRPDGHSGTRKDGTDDI